jgi:hypothetical protein
LNPYGCERPGFFPSPAASPPDSSLDGARVCSWPGRHQPTAARWKILNEEAVIATA